MDTDVREKRLRCWPAGGGTRSQGMRQPLETGKGKETDPLPLSLQKECSPADTRLQLSEPDTGLLTSRTTG